MVQSAARFRWGLARAALLGALALGAWASAPADAEANDWRYRPAPPPAYRPYYPPPHYYYAPPRPYYGHWHRHHHRHWDNRWDRRGWDRHYR